MKLSFLKHVKAYQWLPLAVLLLGLSLSFFHGWYSDESKPQSGVGWADQDLYRESSDRLASGRLPTENQLHFAVGYPLLGVLGKIVSGSDPFVVVSLLLLLGSAIFCFLAMKHLFGNVWALIFCALLFYWDGFARTFHYSSELFAMPWNNQILFFAFAFFFWLFATRLQKSPTNRLVVAASLVSGLTFLAREETILFVAPLMAAYLLLTKVSWRKWILCYAIIGLCFVPQIAVKQAVVGSFTESTHDSSYSSTLSEKYFQPDYFVRNVNEVLINSNSYDSEATNRDALFQESAWLWLAPVGLIIALLGRYPIGLKIFVIASLLLMTFYLSGYNMSANKLNFHCLRYISPAFIALNLGVILAIREVWNQARRGAKPLNKNKSKLTTSVLQVAQTLPFAVPIFAATAGLFVIALLLLSSLYNLIVWPGLLALLVLSFVIAHRYAGRLKMLGSRKEQLLVGIAAILFILVWCAVNVKYTSQHVYVNRDPGIYTVTAAELIDSNDLKLDQETIFNNTKGVTDASAAFGYDVNSDTSLYAQGAHLLPVFLGLGGRIAGESAMLHLGPVIAAAALLSFYGLVRIFVMPRWALLATVAIALSLPFIYFSRDTYTEPLAMLFTFGGLSTLWLAHQNKKLWLWALAGLVLGAGTLTRIDGYLTIAAVLAYGALYLATQRKAFVKQAAKNVVALAVGMAAIGLVGWLDLTKLSSGYYHDLQHKFMMEVFFLGAMSAILLVTLFLAWKTNIISKLEKTTKAWRRPALVGLVASIVVGLASRPLWYEGHGPRRNGLIEGIQQATGAVVDGTRNYAELTFNWNAWYIGPILAVLGMAGFVIATYYVSRSSKHLKLLGPSLIVIFITAVIYLFKPNITADQIWASRRMLPVIMPGLAFFGVYALSAMLRKWRPSKNYKIAAVWVGIVIATLAPIAFVSAPFWRVRTETPLLSQVHRVCAELPPNAVILWAGRLGVVATQTTEAFCDKPSLNIRNTDQTNLSVVYEEATAKGYIPFVGVTPHDKKKGILSQQNMSSVSSVSYTRLEYTLERPPRSIGVHETSILLGKIQRDGTLTGIE